MRRIGVTPDVAVFSYLRIIVMKLVRRSGHLSIHQVLRKLAYDIKGILPLGRGDNA